MRSFHSEKIIGVRFLKDHFEPTLEFCTKCFFCSKLQRISTVI